MSKAVDPREKANYYYRKSLTLKRRFEECEDSCMLLDTLPESYLEKIDLHKAAMCAMELTEKLVKLTEPSILHGTADAPEVYKRLAVEIDNPLPGISEEIKTDARITISYKPSQEEIEVFERLKDHVYRLKPIVEGKPGHRKCSLEEFNKKLKKWKTKTGFAIQRGPLISSMKLTEEEPK